MSPHTHPGLREEPCVVPDEPTGWRALLAVAGLVCFLLIEFAVIVAFVWAAGTAVTPCPSRPPPQNAAKPMRGHWNASA